MIRGYIIVLYDPVLLDRHLGKSLSFVKSVQQVVCSSAYTSVFAVPYCCLF